MYGGAFDPASQGGINMDKKIEEITAGIEEKVKELNPLKSRD